MSTSEPTTERIVEALAERVQMLDAPAFNRWQACFLAALEEGLDVAEAFKCADKAWEVLEKEARDRRRRVDDSFKQVPAVLEQRRQQRTASERTRFAKTRSADAGRWITIGATEGEDGNRHGGSPVFVKDGRIVKGHPQLAGKAIGDIRGSADPSSHRQQLNREKEYQRAVWSKKARAEGIDPAQMHQLAAEFLAHDAAHKDDIAGMLAEVRRTHPHLKAVGLHAGRGADVDSVRGLDDIADAFAHRGEYAHLFPRGQSSEERLFDLLAAGNAQKMAPDDAYEQALDALRGQQQEDDWVPFSKARHPA